MRSSRKRDFGVCFSAESASLCSLTMVNALFWAGRTDREISREHFQVSLESPEKSGVHREMKINNLSKDCSQQNILLF